MPMETLLDAIYASAVDAARWPPALEAICAAFGACSAVLVMTDPLNSRADIAIATGLFTEPHIEADYRANWMHRDPGLALFSGMRAGTVAITSRVWSLAERRAMPFYQEFYVRHGFLDSMCVALQQGGGRIGLLALARARGEPEFDEDDAARYRLLMPHLQRALQLHREFSGRLREGRSLAAMTDRLTCGTIFLDGDRQALMTNVAARTILARADGLSLHNQRLTITHDQAAAALFARHLSGVLAGGGGSGGQLLVRRAEGRLPYGLTVSPQPRISSSFDRQLETGALVLVNDAWQAPADAIAIAAAHFGLTPAETELLSALIDGRSPRDHAAARKVTLHTARFHLKGLFAKTGVRGQAELTRLVIAIAGSLGRMTE